MLIEFEGTECPVLPKSGGEGIEEVAEQVHPPSRGASTPNVYLMF